MTDLAFPYAQRRRRVREEMTRRDVGLLVSDKQPDIRYFTGCQDAGGYLLLADTGDAILITNAHDAPQARAEADGTDVLAWWPGGDAIASCGRFSQLKGSASSRCRIRRRLWTPCAIQNWRS